MAGGAVSRITNFAVDKDVLLVSALKLLDGGLDVLSYPTSAYTKCACRLVGDAGVPLPPASGLVRFGETRLRTFMPPSLRISSVEKSCLRLVAIRAMLMTVWSM